MKIIFLDIDGVMNSENFYHSTPNFKYDMFCPKSVKLLNKLIDKTGAKIVVSSSWRLNRSIEEIAALFMKNRIYNVLIGKTHKLQYANWRESVARGNEIKQFLTETIHSMNQAVDNYVIIDDDIDFLIEQQPHFVKTDPIYGFNKEAYNKALEILTS